jgi:AcrR family transcriptional regulator
MSAQEKILTAAMQLLTERGFAATTMDAVAMRADIPQSELYVSYRSRSELLAGLLRYHSGDPQELSISGELRDDLVAVVEHLHKAIHQCRVLLAVVCSEATRDLELRRELRLFLGSWREPVLQLLSRAAQDRQLPSEVKPEAAADALCAIVWFGVVVAGQLEIDGVAEQLTDRMLNGWRV